MTRRTGGGWNRGKTVGKKRPFSEAQVQMIRLALQAREDVRGLAMFETAISVILRASDFMTLKVGDVVSMGMVVEDFEFRQQKTKRGVKCSLSDRARTALEAYLAAEQLLGLEAGKWRQRPLWLDGGRTLKMSTYRRIIRSWAQLAHANPDLYGTHSLRRTMPAHIYKKTKDIAAAQQLLGHSSIASTASYLDVSRDEAIAVKRKYEI